MKGKNMKVVIVGGGPAGMLAGISAAKEKRNIEMQLYSLSLKACF